MLKRLVSVLLLFIAVQMMFAVTAAAYLDPSAMTYVIQAVAGIVIAGGAAVVIYWKKLKLYLKKKKRQTTQKKGNPDKDNKTAR